MSLEDFVLIVEDTLSLAAIYETHLQNHHYKTRSVATGAKAISVLEHATPTAILLDFNLPDMQGLEILKRVRADNMNSAVIVITGEASLDTAVEAMQAGADNFLAKPVDPDRLLITLANAIEKRQPKRIAITPQKNDRSQFCGFIGKSAEMQAVYRIIENAARSQAPVMILGESGTGKEVAAQALHSLSTRKNQAFIALNCAAIPHDLLESEIFGHVKGAFTGATSNRDGAAKLANGGTLFLDELAEMPIGLQSKLLRFIQEGKFTPVGSSETFHADIRFICATNRNPFDAIKHGVLREDLYYRLAVIPVELPPLCARGEDIVLLAKYFLEKVAKEENKAFHRLSPEAEILLERHRWLGNVRELENIIRHAVVMHDGEEITAEMLSMLSFGGLYRHPEARNAEETDIIINKEEILPLKDIEREAIIRALKICDHNITEAARRLELNPATIHRKLKQWSSVNEPCW